MGLTKKPQEALTVGASGNLRASTAVGEAEADQMGPKILPRGPQAHMAPLTTLEHSFDIQSFTQEQIWLPLQSLQEVELVSPAPASSKDHPPTCLPPRPQLHIAQAETANTSHPDISGGSRPLQSSISQEGNSQEMLCVHEYTGVCNRGWVIIMQKAWVSVTPCVTTFPSLLHQGQTSCKLQVACSDFALIHRGS